MSYLDDHIIKVHTFLLHSISGSCDPGIIKHIIIQRNRSSYDSHLPSGWLIGNEFDFKHISLRWDRNHFNFICCDIQR